MSKGEIFNHNKEQPATNILDLRSIAESAYQSKNILLIDYISEFCTQKNLEIPKILDKKDIWKSENKAAETLRWFDTLPLAIPENIDPIQKIRKKIENTVRQIEKMRHGGLIACIIVPTLNEEGYLPKLLHSIHEQRTDYPVIVVISDNGSTDQTINVARQNGANSLQENIRGIGPARQRGLDYVKQYIDVDPQKVIIIQLDADEFMTNRLFIQEVCSKYKENNQLMASVGPIEYPVVFANRQSILISGGKQFREMFDTFSIKEMFGQCGRSIDDYLLGPDYRFFAGGNSVYRLSLFSQTGFEFPKDKSWESITLSVQIQQTLKPDQIAFLPFQTIQSSVRSFSTEEGIVSEHLLKRIREKGYIPPFKSEDSLSPLITLRQLIRKIDEKTYSLSEFDEILGVFLGTTESIANNPSIEILPVKHAVTEQMVTGKFIVIRRKGKNV